MLQIKKMFLKILGVNGLKLMKMKKLLEYGLILLLEILVMEIIKMIILIILLNIKSLVIKKKIVKIFMKL